MGSVEGIAAKGEMARELIRLKGEGKGTSEGGRQRAVVLIDRFGEPSLLVRRRHEEAGTPFADRTDIDHDVFRAHGGSVPIFVDGEVVGTITMSGEPDVVDHALVAETIRRYRSV